MNSLLISIVCFYVGLKLQEWINAVYSFFVNRNLNKRFAPLEAHPSKLCKGPHLWMDIQTVSDKGMTATKVCRICGFVSGSDQILTPETLDQLEESNKIRQIEERLHEEFLDQEESEVKKLFETELQNGLSFEKIAAIHSAGQTFSQRYAMYRSSKKEEINKELTKVNA